jgi:hypothetical protein
MAGMWLEECLGGRLIPVVGGAYIQHLAPGGPVDPWGLALAQAGSAAGPATWMYVPAGGEDAAHEYFQKFEGDDREGMVAVPLGAGADAAFYERLAEGIGLPVRVLRNGVVSSRSALLDGVLVILPLPLVAARRALESLPSGGEGSVQRLNDWLGEVGRIRNDVEVGWSGNAGATSWSTSLLYAAGVYAARYGGIDIAAVLAEGVTPGWSRLLSAWGLSDEAASPGEVARLLGGVSGARALVRTSDEVFWLFNQDAAAGTVRVVQPARDGRPDEVMSAAAVHQMLEGFDVRVALIDTDDRTPSAVPLTPESLVDPRPGFPVEVEPIGAAMLSRAVSSAAGEAEPESLMDWAYDDLFPPGTFDMFDDYAMTDAPEVSAFLADFPPELQFPDQEQMWLDQRAPMDDSYLYGDEYLLDPSALYEYVNPPSPSVEEDEEPFAAEDWQQAPALDVTGPEPEVRPVAAEELDELGQLSLRRRLVIAAVTRVLRIDGAASGEATSMHSNLLQQAPWAAPSAAAAQEFEEALARLDDLDSRRTRRTGDQHVDLDFGLPGYLAELGRQEVADQQTVDRFLAGFRRAAEQVGGLWGGTAAHVGAVADQMATFASELDALEARERTAEPPDSPVAEVPPSAPAISGRWVRPPRVVAPGRQSGARQGTNVAAAYELDSLYEEGYYHSWQQWKVAIRAYRAAGDYTLPAPLPHLDVLSDFKSRLPPNQRSGPVSRLTEKDREQFLADAGERPRDWIFTRDAFRSVTGFQRHPFLIWVHFYLRWKRDPFAFPGMDPRPPVVIVAAAQSWLAGQHRQPSQVLDDHLIAVARFVGEGPQHWRIKRNDRGTSVDVVRWDAEYRTWQHELEQWKSGARAAPPALTREIVLSAAPVVRPDRPPGRAKREDLAALLRANELRAGSYTATRVPGRLGPISMGEVRLTAAAERRRRAADRPASGAARDGDVEMSEPGEMPPRTAPVRARRTDAAAPYEMGSLYMAEYRSWADWHLAIRLWRAIGDYSLPVPKPTPEVFVDALRVLGTDRRVLNPAKLVEDDRKRVLEAAGEKPADWTFLREENGRVLDVVRHPFLVWVHFYLQRRMNPAEFAGIDPRPPLAIVGGAQSWLSGQRRRPSQVTERDLQAVAAFVGEAKHHWMVRRNAAGKPVDVVRWDAEYRSWQVQLEQWKDGLRPAPPALTNRIVMSAAPSVRPDRRDEPRPRVQDLAALLRANELTEGSYEAWTAPAGAISRIDLGATVRLLPDAEERRRAVGRPVPVFVNEERPARDADDSDDDRLPPIPKGTVVGSRIRLSPLELDYLLKAPIELRVSRAVDLHQQNGLRKDALAEALGLRRDEFETLVQKHREDIRERLRRMRDVDTESESDDDEPVPTPPPGDDLDRRDRLSEAEISYLTRAPAGRQLDRAVELHLDNRVNLDVLATAVGLTTEELVENVDRYRAQLRAKLAAMRAGGTTDSEETVYDPTSVYSSEVYLTFTEWSAAMREWRTADDYSRPVPRLNSRVFREGLRLADPVRAAAAKAQKYLVEGDVSIVLKFAGEPIGAWLPYWTGPHIRAFDRHPFYKFAHHLHQWRRWRDDPSRTGVFPEPRPRVDVVAATRVMLGRPIKRPISGSDLRAFAQKMGVHRNYWSLVKGAYDGAWIDVVRADAKFLRWREELERFRVGSSVQAPQLDSDIVRSAMFFFEHEREQNARTVLRDLNFLLEKVGLEPAAYQATTATNGNLLQIERAGSVWFRSGFTTTLLDGSRLDPFAFDPKTVSEHRPLPTRSVRPRAALLSAAGPGRSLGPVEMPKPPAELRLAGSWNRHAGQLAAIRAAAERFDGPLIAVGIVAGPGDGEPPAEVWRQLNTLVQAGETRPVVVTISHGVLDESLGRAGVTRVRYTATGLDGGWEVVGPDGSERPFGADLTDEVLGAARAVASTRPIDPRRLQVAALLAEWSRAPDWEEAGRFFGTHRAELMAPDVAPELAADDVRAVALELEQAGRPAAVTQPSASRTGDRAEDWSGPLGGDFVFAYLAAEERSARLRWDGLLMSAMVDGRLPFEQGLRLVGALRDEEHAATSGRVFRAVVLLLERGVQAWEEARSLVRWKDCRLPTDAKLAWFERLEKAMARAVADPAVVRNATLLDRLADAIAECA